MSQNKQAGNKASLSNDTEAFRRTLLWVGVATVIHVLIIGGVSAGQKMFSSDDKADAAKPKVEATASENAAPAANAAANAAPRNVGNPLDDRNRSTGRDLPPSLTETLPPPSGGPVGGGGVNLD